MLSSWVASLFSIINTAITNSIDSMVGYSFQLETTAAAAYMLYCVYQGFKFLSFRSNGGDLSIDDLKWDFFRMTAICFVVFTSGYYLQNIVPLIRDTGYSLSNIIVGNSSDVISTANGSSTFTTISQSWTLVNNSIINTMGDPLTDMKNDMYGLLMLLLLAIGFLAFLVVSLIMLISLDLGTALLVVVGPLFILFGLYEQTRAWFYNWLRQIAYYIILTVLFEILMKIIIEVFNGIIYVDIVNIHNSTTADSSLPSFCLV